MRPPILYSYRRCPYAMRARMALRYAGIEVEIREIALKAKPAHMLQLSPKGTVPVLQLPDGAVLEQSLDIMNWALQQADADDWRMAAQTDARAIGQALIDENDGAFKQALDRYKYAIRFPQQPAEHYRQQGEAFLARLEQRLTDTVFLLGNRPSQADIAIFPFVRQFAMVDADWFGRSPYPRLRQWLQDWLDSPLFAAIMEKYPIWEETA